MHDDENRNIVNQFKKRLEKLEDQIAAIDENIREILRIVRKQEEE